jgi:hypothetical protein
MTSILRGKLPGEDNMPLVRLPTLIHWYELMNCRTTQRATSNEHDENDTIRGSEEMEEVDEIAEAGQFEQLEELDEHGELDELYHNPDDPETHSQVPLSIY